MVVQQMFEHHPAVYVEPLFQAIALASFGPEEERAGKYETDLRVFTEVIDLQLQLFRHPDIIGILKRYQLSASFPDPDISGARRSSILLPYVAHLPRVWLENLFGMIGRAIIDNDQLKAA